MKTNIAGQELLPDAGIYILTNKINGKQYVGKDTQLGRRVKDHLGGYSGCPAICNAIKKYGADNFDVELIPYPGITNEALCAVEMQKIKKLGSKKPNGYNLTDGGDGTSGWKHTDESRKKMSEALKGNSRMKGKKHSDKVRQKISAARKGEKHPNYGKKLSVETRKKISEANKKQIPWSKGKKLSVEHRHKISAARRRFSQKPSPLQLELFND